MRFNRPNFLALALSVAICGIPGVMASSARAQEPSQQEPTKTEKEKKKEQQAKEQAEKEKRSAESKKTSAERTEAKQNENRKETREGQVSQGRPAPRNVHYHFRQQDAAKLRQHYQAQLAHVNRANRPQVVAGGTIPTTYVTYIQPVPQDVIVYLEPPPPGYQIGFLDGYIIVYDPTTFFVVDVIDLL